MKYLYSIILSIAINLVLCNFSQAQYDDADAVYIKLLKEYQLNEDGSFDYHFSENLKLQTYLAFNYHYGETFITYNPEYQKLKINSSYTIMANGKKVITPGNAFNEVLPGFASGAPAYNNLRQMVVVHTALERNSYIYLDYNITSSKNFLPAFMGNEVLSENSPIKELTINIRIPKDKTLYYKLINIRATPFIYNDKNMKVYSWTIKNIQRHPNEALQAKYGKSLPRLLFSTEYSLNKVYDDFINQPAFKFEVNEQMSKAVDSIVKENENKLNIALDLQKKIVKNFAYYHIPLIYTAYRCRTAEETWQSNGGTKLEKTTLLTALLNKANIKAIPVAVITSDKIDKKGNSLSFKNITGNLMTINDFLVRVKIKAYNDIYLSATSLANQNLIYQLKNNTLLLLKSDKKKLIAYDKKQNDNEISVIGKFIINAKYDLKSQISVKLTNDLNPFFTLTRDKDKAKNFFKGISYSDIKNYNINKLEEEKTTINYGIEKQDIFKKEANYLFWEMPSYTKGINSWHLNILPKERYTTLELPSAIDEKYEYNIIIPIEFKIITPETKIEKKNDVGNIVIELNKSGNTINITREIKIQKKDISIENYKAFRELMKIWNNKKYSEIIFKN